jgi:hypothetical protein
MRVDESDLGPALRSAYDFGEEYPSAALLERISAALDRPARRAGFGWIALAAAIAIAIVVVATLLSIPRRAPVLPQPVGPPSAEAGVAAILANNHLVYIPPGGGKPKWDVAVAPAPDLAASHGGSGLGHRVAASPDGSLVYALPAQDFIGGTHLAVVDTATGRLIRDVQLPNPGGSARYGALTVGPSGDVWIVGSVGPVASQSDLGVKRIEVLSVNPRDWSITTWLGRDMSHWAPQGPVLGDFDIYEVQVTSDGTRVYYSYTGGLLGFAGLDWIDLAGTRAKTCVPAAPDTACIPGLAGFLVQGNSVFITTGNDSPSGAIDYYGLDGVLRNHIELGLLPGFLEDFAAAPDASSLFLFGSCGYSGGMAMLDLASLKSIVIVKAESQYTHSANPPCGQSSVFVSDNLIALGHVAALLPADVEGRVLYVDPVTGSVMRSVAIAAEPIAVAAVITK